MSELEQQISNRRDKRDELRGRGIDPYPRRVKFDLEPSEVQRRHGERQAAELDEAGVRLRVPGRVQALRKHGKTTFLDLYDGRAKLQILVRSASLDDASAEVLKQLDLGDYALAGGALIRTRTGELTVAAEELVLLSKALRPMPEKWHGLSDVETRYRRRYLDLVVNPDSRRVFETRARVISLIRRHLDREDFLEVETPMMHSMAGGAAARPFETHHNALDLQLYLRIAPELFLKRLLVGGLHRVYEINRNFRNEGISTQHNPEFTMLEFYWAYSDYLQLMDFTERLIGELVVDLVGEPALTWKGERLEFSAPWQRFTVRGALTHFEGIEPQQMEHAADVAAIFRQRDLPWPPSVNDPGHPVLTAGSKDEFEKHHPEVAVPEGWYGKLLMDLFESLVEQRLQQPTFIHDYPIDVSPFAKATEDDDRFVERFELYIGGMEIANAFTELNDPDVQAERFQAQLRARRGGDDEAHGFDSDYVEALEHGMPPAGGEGVGIDRLTMLLTDSASIRDVILFPLLRPDSGGPSASGGGGGRESE